MIDVAQIAARTHGHTLVRGQDTLAKGHVRLETAFLYPDGSSIDVFVVEEGSQQKLSDLGQTTSWLLDMQVRPWLSKKRQRLVEDALRIYGVQQSGGALELPLPAIEQIMEHVVTLGQACVRVADITYTRRSALQTYVTEEIEEFLVDTELPFEADKVLVGKHGANVRVDFLVHGAKTQSALLSLHSGSTSQAHTLANEIFRRWYDLDSPGRSEQRVTVYDDRQDVYREEDLLRLRDLSDVVALSDRQAMRDLLAA